MCIFAKNLKEIVYGKEKWWQTVREETGQRTAAESLPAQSERDVLVQADIQST
jgi:hypothetical protein